MDFYQLAVLYKLACGDVGDLSNRSHPPLMPMVTRSQSRSTAIEPDETSSSPTPSTSPEPTTPKHRSNAVLPVLSSTLSTPLPQGSSIMKNLAPDTDQPQKGDSAKYEAYIKQDFRHHRVFVGMDVFMECVLNVPGNWKGEWAGTIRKVKNDRTFRAAYEGYCDKLNSQSFEEAELYEPLVSIANAIFNVAKSSSEESAIPATDLRYLVNDPKRVVDGVMTDLSPDIVAVDKGFLRHMHPEERRTRKVSKTSLTWAQPLRVLEVKPWNGALVDGTFMPRLLVNGEVQHPLLMTFRS